MPAFKAPDFKQRTAAASEAKQKALELLRTKPVMDEAVVAEKRAARLAREAAEAERRRAKREAEQAAKEAKRAAAAAAAEAEAAAKPQPKTEAELKAARDARYAARKQRKG